MKEEMENEVAVGLDDDADQSEVFLEENEPDFVWVDIIDNVTLVVIKT